MSDSPPTLGGHCSPMIRVRWGGSSRAVDAAFVLAVVAALAFAFTNGFHDAANAIATLVATRGASPGAAIALAAVFNLLGPLLLGGAVANTIATIVEVPAAQTVEVVGRRPDGRRDVERDHLETRAAVEFQPCPGRRHGEDCSVILVFVILDGPGKVAGLPVHETVAHLPVEHEPDAVHQSANSSAVSNRRSFSWTANHRAAV
jgi:hypothetical protein